MLNRSLINMLLIGALSAFLPIACDSHSHSEASPVQTTAPERIVLIVIDTLRQDHVSAHGGRIATPNIDALAKRGQIFPNALSSFYQTTMSMGSLFTGRTPSLESHDSKDTLAWNGRTWCGMRRFSANRDDPSCIPKSLMTLAESLSKANYHTIGIVNNALLFRPMGFDQGFDQWVEIGRRTPKQIAKNPDPFGFLGAASRDYKSTLTAFEASLEARPSDRFFLYVHFMDVHDYVLMKGQSYESSVARADQGVGGVVRALDERGLLEGSVVLLTSDHGERLGEKHFTEGLPYHFGHPAFEEHIRVPMIVAPAVLDRSDQTLRSDDVYRLILDIAHVPKPGPADLLKGELFVGERDYLIYRQERWKSFIERATGAHSLIDLETDPGEQVDVSAAHPEILEKHQSRVAALRAALITESAKQGELNAEDERRLRALGYLD